MTKIEMIHRVDKTQEDLLSAIEVWRKNQERAFKAYQDGELTLDKYLEYEELYNQEIHLIEQNYNYYEFRKKQYEEEL